jgi:hypothetical protein
VSDSTGVSRSCDGGHRTSLAGRVPCDGACQLVPSHVVHTLRVPWRSDILRGCTQGGRLAGNQNRAADRALAHRAVKTRSCREHGDVGASVHADAETAAVVDELLLFGKAPARATHKRQTRRASLSAALRSPRNRRPSNTQEETALVPTSKKIRKQLNTARKNQRLVRITRGKGWTKYDGYVVAVSREWCALQSVAAAQRSGLVLFRTADVRKVGKAHHNKELARRALEHEGAWPPGMPALLDLQDVRSVLFTAGSIVPTIAFATEQYARDFFVGNVFRITKKYLDTMEILPNGQWNEDLQSWYLDDITRVVLHDPYVDTLNAVAGPMP